MSLRSRFAAYLEELKQRKVLQTGAAYAIVAWVLLQVAETTFEPLHLPEWALTLLIVVVIAGFPIVLMMSWFFNFTLGGLKKDTGASRQVDEIDLGSQAESMSKGPSVAVLSFDDMSPGKDQEYLCDGIAEEILSRLTQIPNLRVASRTSSFRFKGKPDDISSIGRKLKVATVLEGSVRKADNQLRITTQLVNADDGYHLWSSAYDRKLEHIFEIQDEIATQVADALKVTLNTDKSGDSYTTSNVQAYDYYLQGLHYFHRWGLRNVEYSIEMFGKAVETDSTYAQAWASLAYSYAMICMYWKSNEDNIASAGAASLKALELSPETAESHVSRGLYHFVKRENPEAIAEFETARRLDPDLFEVHYFYGRVRFQRGELTQAAELFEQAERLRPDDFQTPIFLRQIYRSQGRKKESKDAARRGAIRAARHLELNPDDTRALNLGLAGLIEIGNKEKAMQYAERSLAIDGENPDTLYNVACGYALIGESDLALGCLERASLRGMAIVEWAQNDSDLASLHDNSRFIDLMTSLKEPQAE